jgi:hypothetical protein
LVDAARVWRVVRGTARRAARLNMVVVVVVVV